MCLRPANVKHHTTTVDGGWKRCPALCVGWHELQLSHKQERSSQDLPNSKELSALMTLGFLFGSKNFPESFCFARIRLDPLGGQVLHHDCISMIVSRFATVTEDLVICCCQINKIFSTRYGSANASSARGPCNFGPLTDLAISVFREMSINTVLTQILTSRKRRL